MNNDFKIILEAMIDNSSLSNVQKQLAKERLKINADISVEDFAKSKQAIEKQIASLAQGIKTILGNAVTDKQASQWAKQYYDGMISGAKEAAKAQESLTNAMAKGREQAEQSRQAEQKRQQMAQNNAINKALEQEYQERQKNIEATKKQAELDKQNALAFTKSASKKLSSAISKYSYGDTSDANAMMKQMNRGLSNFGDLSNVQGNIAQLSSTVDKIIADLKVSHEQSLQALNEEIKAEQALQSQKDSFNKKNINAIDYEIQKREEEAKAFSSMLQAQMQEQQKMQSEVNKIQLSMSTGGYESKVDSLIGKTQQWVDANGNARISTDALQTAMNNLNTAYANITATGGNTVANQQALIQAEKALDVEVKKVQSSVTSMNATMAKSTAVDSLRQKVQQFYDINTKSHRTYGTQLQNIMAQLASGTEVPITKLRQLEQEFINVQNSARQAGKLGLSFFDTLKQGMKSFSYWTSSTFLVMRTIQSIKSAVSTVKELDTALVDLKKTTTMTAKELEDFYYTSNETAKKMGVTTQSIIEQASAWSRLGYSSQEAATKMAEYSSMFATISPGMDLDSATDGLVSVMKAFKIGAEDVDDVVDGIMSKINIIGNTQALNNSDIVDFLTRSSSAMAEANNSLEETIALGTAATEITRDAASVGNMLKTVSMRIRGYDEETESYSEELENLSGKIADLTKTASSPGGISLFTDASKTTYKSTYQILKDISEIYDELEDKTQAELLEALAGKRQGQAVAAIINNFENAEKSMESMANSAGNAEAEMSIAIDSIAYKANTLSEIGTGISQNLFGREDMKTVLDTINSLGEGIQWLTDKLGLFGSISLGAGLFAGFKNAGICV